MIKRKIKAWSETQIHDHVVERVGKDIIFPVGYQVLIELFRPSKETKEGFIVNDIAIHQETLSTMIGKVLRFGEDAFQDERRFPNGRYLNYGDWAVFRGSERQRIRINDVDLAFINDDRFLGVTAQPEEIKTTFDLQSEYRR